MAPDLKSFEADYVWIEEHRDALVKEFANQWVGVQNRRVVAHDADLNTLLRRLPDPAHTAVDFITPQHWEIVLWQ